MQQDNSLPTLLVDALPQRNNHLMAMVQLLISKFKVTNTTQKSWRKAV